MTTRNYTRSVNNRQLGRTGPPCLCDPSIYTLSKWEQYSAKSDNRAPNGDN